MSFSKRRGKLEEACDNENDNNEANQAMGKASRGIWGEGLFRGLWGEADDACSGDHAARLTMFL